MLWGFKGRIIYLIILLAIVSVVFGIPIYNFFNKEADCFDGKKNGSELGADCGGECSKVCEFSAEAPIVLWSRSFEIRDGVYNSIAMIENPNVGAGASSVSYTFKLFDDRNVLVYERKGSTDIPAQTRFPIFEASIITGNRIPNRTFFDFNNDINWLKQESDSSDLRIREQKLSGADSSPRVEAVIENRGFKEIKNLQVFVIIYDMVDNAMSGSSTFIESIPADSKIPVVFTWPEAFSSPVGRIEVLPKFSSE